MTDLHYRILDISYRHRLSHIGSCISAVDIVDRIYREKRPDEPFCMGAAHAGLALYVVLEKHLGHDAEAILDRYGIHSTRAPEYGIEVSGGSLGQVETVAAGLALANRDRRVWLLSTDGGAAEGAFWEALQFKAEQQLSNLRWFVNANGFAACREVPRGRLANWLYHVDPTVTVVQTDFAGIPFLNGLNAHYHVMTEADWTWVQANRPAGTASPKGEQ